MGLSRKALALLLLFSHTAMAAQPDGRHILYAIQTGDFKSALSSYKEFRDEPNEHNSELLQQIGLVMIDRGWRSQDPETMLLTLFGAGISTHERCQYILEAALSNPVPQFQLIALNFLSKLPNDRSDDAIYRTLNSNHLLIRLEILNYLAERKHPNAVLQMDTLMSKVPSSIHPVFPQLYAMEGSAAAIRTLKRMMSDPDAEMRIAAILSSAQYSRDDLLPQIRRLISHHNNAQQEACAYALGIFRDEASAAKLEELAKSRSPNIRLAAIQALYRIGRKERRSDVEAVAREGSLTAIAMLGEMAGSEDLLAKLVENENIQVRVNAAFALLQLQDPRCMKCLINDILIEDSRDIALTKVSSAASGMYAIKAVPSAAHNLKEDSVAYELSLSMRETALRQAVNLPQDSFLKLAETLFEKHQNALIPTLAELLENLNTSQSVDLLKKYQQKAGAPLIRNYCNLALYNLREPGPWEENLRNWVTSQQAVELIRLRPVIPWEARDHMTAHDLTPHETSRLLIASFEAFARSQDDKGIDVLIDALVTGNEKNRYALAGLLIRATL